MRNIEAQALWEAAMDAPPGQQVRVPFATETNANTWRAFMYRRRAAWRLRCAKLAAEWKDPGQLKLAEQWDHLFLRVEPGPDGKWYLVFGPKPPVKEEYSEIIEPFWEIYTPPLEPAASSPHV